jgi:hypothetical protein
VYGSLTQVVPKVKWLSGEKIRHYCNTRNSYDHTRLTLNKNDEIKINQTHIYSKSSARQTPGNEIIMGKTRDKQPVTQLVTVTKIMTVIPLALEFSFKF